MLLEQVVDYLQVVINIRASMLQISIKMQMNKNEVLGTESGRNFI